MSTPNYAAIIETPGARLTLKQREIPTCGPHDLLIHNSAIACNPVDWKIQTYDFFIQKYPIVLGSDISGTIIALGSEVKNFVKGDRVTGYAGVIYNNDINHGAWQTYTLLRDISTAKIPDFMSFEEGSVFPMALATAGMALFVDLRIPRPPATIPSVEKEALLVWGGSSSVGCMAIQIAKTLGIKVFATASSANHEYIKGLGASQVFDYRDKNIVSNILAAAKVAGVVITKVFDSISENGTPKLAAQVLTEGNGGGYLALTLGDDTLKSEGVRVSSVMAFRIATDEAEFGAWLFNEWLTDALAKGSIVPAPKIQIVEGGVGAAQQVFDMLKAGVSLTKLVVKVE